MDSCVRRNDERWDVRATFSVKAASSAMSHEVITFERARAELPLMVPTPVPGRSFVGLPMDS